MFAKIIIWIMTKAFESRMREKIEPCIKKLYRRMAETNPQITIDNIDIYRTMRNRVLILKTEIVKVKKGTRRYDVMFIETHDGKVKFNLGRHHKDSGVGTVISEE